MPVWGNNSINKKIMDKEIKKWVIDYQEDEDTLFVSRSRIPKDALLYGMNDGYDCYVSKGKVVGIVIEYFKTDAAAKLKAIKKSR